MSSITACPGRDSGPIIRACGAGLLVTVAHRRAVDVVRSEGSRRARESGIGDPKGSPASRDTDAVLLARDEAAWIADAVSHLPKEEHDALVAALYGQCTYREAASVPAQPEGTTKARTRAALHRLAFALAGPTIDIPTSVTSR